MTRARWILTLLALFAFTSPALAGSKGGVRMPDSLDVEGKTLVLNGMGVREATVFNVDVYVAGLYVESKSSDGDAIAGSKTVKRLVLKFVRDVDKSDMADAWKEGFEKRGALGEHRASVDRLRGWMSDLKEGDTLTFTYVPDKGLTVEVKGATKGTIAGEGFARNFFLIWLGSSPPNAGLKRGLLGK